MQDISQVPPKALPFKCPVCSGFGTVSKERTKCHGCNGRGWITIDNETGFPLEREKNEE